MLSRLGLGGRPRIDSGCAGVWDDSARSGFIQAARACQAAHEASTEQAQHACVSGRDVQQSSVVAINRVLRELDTGMRDFVRPVWREDAATTRMRD